MRPGANYPAAGTELYRGLELFQPADYYQISPAGFVSEICVDIPCYSDQVRVLTACD